MQLKKEEYLRSYILFGALVIYIIMIQFLDVSYCNIPKIPNKIQKKDYIHGPQNNS